MKVEKQLEYISKECNNDLWISRGRNDWSLHTSSLGTLLTNKCCIGKTFEACINKAFVTIVKGLPVHGE